MWMSTPHNTIGQDENSYNQIRGYRLADLSLEIWLDKDIQLTKVGT